MEQHQSGRCHDRQRRHSYGPIAGLSIISYSLYAGCSLTYDITVADTGACTPCSVFSGGYTPLGTLGTITGNVGPGNYYISSNVTITGNDTFDNAIVLVAPGDTIYIDTASSLVLDSSHIFSNCVEWAGMALMPGKTHSGRLSAMEHSCVEDAWCAAYAPNPVTPATGYVVNCDNALFNRNVVGISVYGYTPNSTNYPFHFTNTVITSRNLQIAGYPFVWPNNTGPGGLKAYWSGADAFTGPYQINNPTPGYTARGALAALRPPMP